MTDDSYRVSFLLFRVFSVLLVLTDVILVLVALGTNADTKVKIF